MRDSLLNKIETARIPYLKAWDKWVDTEFCFLSQQEIKYLKLFLELKSVRSVVDRDQTSENTIRKILNSVLAKLIEGLSIFNYWLQRKDRAVFFSLEIPIACIRAPDDQKDNLFTVADTLLQIISLYAMNDNRRKGIDNKLLRDLRSMLNKFGRKKASLNAKRRMKQRRNSFNREDLGFRFSAKESSLKLDHRISSWTSSQLLIAYNSSFPRGLNGRLDLGLGPPIRKTRNGNIN